MFLSEAFTRPKVMRYLAKAGFSQSYSYFTWRNTKDELVDYFTELTSTDVREYMRPNLFANTPDILPDYLQTGGRPAFQVRLCWSSSTRTIVPGSAMSSRRIAASEWSTTTAITR